MLIIGAKGHARAIIDVFEKNNFMDEILLYDDISKETNKYFYNKYLIIRSIEELVQLNIADKRFVLGIGNPSRRKELAQKFMRQGFELCSIISKNTIIGNYNVNLCKGVNIMHNVMISNDVFVGEGTLINAGVFLHHNVSVGDFSEISPKVCLTGGVRIGSGTFIGVGVNIIPRVKIGNNCIIGAGSVVIRDVPDNALVVGVPARVIKKVKNK